MFVSFLIFVISLILRIGAERLALTYTWLTKAVPWLTAVVIGCAVIFIILTVIYVVKVIKK